jgi:methylated-DNA-[protein]-cysteine S-methyltransferase
MRRHEAHTDILHLGSVSTRSGLVHIAAGPRGLVAVALPGQRLGSFLADLRARRPGVTLRRDPAAVATATRQIAEYFAGRRRRFELRFELEAPPFTQRVLGALCRIPYGETRTYGAIARAVGRPGAARAVGQACGRNPLPLLIPCHRVVAEDGGLGGFGGGPRLKQRLLEIERLHRRGR